MTGPKFTEMEMVIRDSLAVFRQWGSFVPPGDIWQYLKTFLIVTVGRRDVLLASGRWSPGMLLRHTVHMTGPMTKSYPA